MSDTPPGHLTQILNKWGDGDAAALDRLIPEVYPELRAMASSYLSRERTGTIQATVLVHDLYLRLLKQQRAPGSRIACSVRTSPRTERMLYKRASSAARARTKASPAGAWSA